MRTRPWSARAALAGVLALMLTGIAGVSTSTAATSPSIPDELNPANRIGDLTIVEPATRTLRNAGDPAEVNTAVGCPDGFRASSRTFLFWPDGTRVPAFAATTRMNETAGYGLDGQPIHLTGVFASAWSNLTDLAMLRTGAATLVVTCDPGGPSDPDLNDSSQPVGNAKYFTLPRQLEIDVANNTWRVAGGPVEEADTTTTLTPTANNDGSVTLTATVAPAGATGDVTFTDVGAGAAVGTDALVGGAASVTVGGLPAGRQYTFRAEYAGDPGHRPSTSNDANVTTVAEPTPPKQEQTEVTVTIPASAATGLQLTVTAGGASLGEATLNGSQFEANGTLGEVRVTDNRDPRNGWALNGQASDFVKSGAPGTTFSAAALGWTPKLVSGPGAAGNAVAPGAGLSTQRTLASLQAGAMAAETRVDADLMLRVPQETPEGAYSATLTLTLI